MYISIDGRRTHYLSLGTGQPVLLLHGWGIDGSVFFSLAKAISTLGYRVIAPDLPGFGKSEGPLEGDAWSVNDYADFVRSFIERLDIKRAVVVGHSFGGRVAIVLAASRERWMTNLILIAAAGIRPPHNLRYHAKRITASTARKVLARLPQGFQHMLLGRLYATLGMTDYARAGGLRRTFVRVVNEDLTPKLSEIDCPTLLVWGLRDKEVPVGAGAEMSRLISGARFEVLDAGHYPFLEAQADCLALIKTFLRSRGEPCSV